MPRPMSNAMLTALSASILRPAIFVDMQFANGSRHVWSGIGTRVWNGKSYIGVGSFGSISPIEEGTTVEAKGIALTLSGIDANLLADTLQEIQIGLPVTVFLALFDASGSLIADPLTSWAGRIDQPEFTISGSEATIVVKCESRILDLNVPSDRRYTQADQAIDHTGDLGFQFVNSLQEVTLYWGSVPQASQNI